MTSNKKIIIITSNLHGPHLDIIEYLTNQNKKIEFVLLDNFYYRKNKNKNYLKFFLKLIKLLKYFFSKPRSVIKYVLYTLQKKILYQNKNLIDICKKLNLKIVKVEDLNSDIAYEILKNTDCKFILTLYSRILSGKFFSIDKIFFNLHSLTLPNFRGLSPIGYREIENDLNYLKINTIFINENLDSGNIIKQDIIDIKKNNFDLIQIEKDANEKSKKLVIESIDLVYDDFKGSSQKLSKKILKNPSLEEFINFFDIINIKKKENL